MRTKFYFIFSAIAVMLILSGCPNNPQNDTTDSNNQTSEQTQKEKNKATSGLENNLIVKGKIKDTTCDITLNAADGTFSAVQSRAEALYSGEFFYYNGKLQLKVISATETFCLTATVEEEKLKPNETVIFESNTVTAYETDKAEFKQSVGINNSDNNSTLSLIGRIYRDNSVDAIWKQNGTFIQNYQSKMAIYFVNYKECYCSILPYLPSKKCNYKIDNDKKLTITINYTYDHYYFNGELTGTINNDLSVISISALFDTVWGLPQSEDGESSNDNITIDSISFNSECKFIGGKTAYINDIYTLEYGTTSTPIVSVNIDQNTYGEIELTFQNANEFTIEYKKSGSKCYGFASGSILQLPNNPNSSVTFKDTSGDIIATGSISLTLFGNCTVIMQLSGTTNNKTEYIFAANGTTTNTDINTYDPTISPNGNDTQLEFDPYIEYSETIFNLAGYEFLSVNAEMLYHDTIFDRTWDYTAPIIFLNGTSGSFIGGGWYNFFTYQEIVESNQIICTMSDAMGIKGTGTFTINISDDYNTIEILPSELIADGFTDEAARFSLYGTFKRFPYRLGGKTYKTTNIIYDNQNVTQTSQMTVEISNSSIIELLRYTLSSSGDIASFTDGDNSFSWKESDNGYTSSISVSYSVMKNESSLTMKINGTFALSSDGKTLILNAEQYENIEGAVHKSLICTFALEE